MMFRSDIQFQRCGDRYRGDFLVRRFTWNCSTVHGLRSPACLYYLVMWVDSVSFAIVDKKREQIRKFYNDLEDDLALF